MNKTVDRLVQHLSKLGFNGSDHSEAIAAAIGNHQQAFTRQEDQITSEGHLLRADLHFGASVWQEGINFTAYDLFIVRHHELQPAVFAGIDVQELDKRLSNINWQEQSVAADVRYFFSDDQNELAGNGEVVRALKDLFLLRSMQEGVLPSSQLLLRHLRGTAAEAFYEMDALEKQFEARGSFDYLHQLPHLSKAVSLLMPSLRTSHFVNLKTRRKAKRTGFFPGGNSM